MPSKYMIHTKPTPHRFKALTGSGVIAWEEGCLRCAVCVKKQCVYGVYDKRGLDTRQMIDSIDNQCMNCFRCIQNCPKGLIHKSVNPEYLAMGDSHWTPEIIARLWYQAETGKIPVSGAGYSGPFSGPGFDAMWTDMSEIVRPTRDGIHGREYISNAVDLGKTPDHLTFTENGELEGNPHSLVNIPLPIIMRLPSFGSLSEKTLKGWAMGAKRLGTFLALSDDLITEELGDYRPHLIPIITPESKLDRLGDGIGLVETSWGEGWRETVDELRRLYPSILIITRLPLTKRVEKRVLSLLESGESIIHLEGSVNGRVTDHESLFVKDGIRSMHMALVEKGIRDEITLLVSGGLAMAENVAKAIICGVDAAYIDFPILIALECRMCRRCQDGLSCPVEVEEAPSPWVASRVVNLLAAWHNQLLEVMGAMGLRDVRRLRGEAGRAIFFEEMDKGIFGSLVKQEEGFELE